MTSIDLIRRNLGSSTKLVLLKVEEMREHSLVFPTPAGGAHTLWLLGHLAYIEALVVRQFMLGEPNPLARWASMFDGEEVSAESAFYPDFDEVLTTCRETRAATVTLLDALSEAELDTPAAAVPKGFEELFGTYRDCLLYTGNHWFMHRGQLADARRAAGLDRMWL